MTKSELLWKLIIFYSVYVAFLNIFSFIKGAPSFFTETGLSKLKYVFGLGSFAGIPEALTFFITFGFALFIGYFIYEALTPSK